MGPYSPAFGHTSGTSTPYGPSAQLLPLSCRQSRTQLGMLCAPPAGEGSELSSSTSLSMLNDAWDATARAACASKTPQLAYQHLCTGEPVCHLCALRLVGLLQHTCLVQAAIFMYHYRRLIAFYAVITMLWSLHCSEAHALSPGADLCCIQHLLK